MPRPALPRPALQTSSRLVQRSYAAGGQCAAFANTLALVQQYAVRLMEEQARSPEPLPLVAEEVRSVAAFSLLLAEGLIAASASVMASAVQHQRHLWLNLADVPSESDRSAIVNAKVTMDGLFGSSLSESVANMDLRKKEAEVVSRLLPRRDPARPADQHQSGSGRSRSAAPSQSQQQPQGSRGRPPRGDWQPSEDPPAAAAAPARPQAAAADGHRDTNPSRGRGSSRRQSTGKRKGPGGRGWS